MRSETSAGTTATSILAQVCPDRTAAAKRVEETMNLASGGFSRESASPLRSGNLSRPWSSSIDAVEPVWTPRPEDVEIDEFRSVRQSAREKYNLNESYFEGVKASF